MSLRRTINRGRDYVDELDILVEAPAELYQNPESLTSLQHRLHADIQSALGITCSVQLVAPQQLQRSEGKAVRVVDKRRL